MTHKSKEEKMKKLVVLIQNPVLLDEFTEQDMRRWWCGRCKKHNINGEIFFEVGGRVRSCEGAKRLASFGIKAKVVCRAV